VNALHARATKLAADLAEERQMNESLRQNQHEWQEKVRVLQEEKESKDKEIGDLKASIYSNLPTAVAFLLGGSTKSVL
jgi:sensor histidine kinase regulating citrate/malate metabolism